MDLSDLSSYYLGLLSLQITVLTLIAAGVIALYQIHDKQTPKRDFKKVVRVGVLVTYFSLAVSLITSTALLTWSSISQHNIFPFINLHLDAIASNDIFSLSIIIATLIMCAVFFYFLWESRALLDTKIYLERLSLSIKQHQFSDYLFHTYSYKPFPRVTLLSYLAGGEKLSKTEIDKLKIEQKEEVLKWQQRFEKTAMTINPISPFIDYCRHNAVNASGDVQSVGIPIVETIILDYINSTEADNLYIPNYIKDVNSELKEAFEGSPLAVKKSYLDMLKSIANAYCEKEDYSQMVNVATQIFVFIKGAQSEDLCLYAVQCMRELTDNYITKNTREKDWRKFNEHFQELSLVVARIAEDYYHNINDLAPVPIIENNRIEIKDFSGEVANYFAQYGDMHEKHSKIFPALYFDAVSVTAEALVNAIKRSKVIKNKIGISDTRYEQTINTLYYIYYSYCKASISENNTELTRQCVYSLTRSLKMLSEKEVHGCALEVADSLVDLGIRIACSPKLKGISAYNGNALVDEIVVCINQYADTKSLADRKSSIEHQLFEYSYEPEAKAFTQRLTDW